MKNFKKSAYLLSFLMLTLCACNEGQKGVYVDGTRYTKSNLEKTLKDTALDNVVAEGDGVIKDAATAVKVVEPILFNTFGESNIAYQRPYEVQRLEGYYIINGTMPKQTSGGTFLVIIDSRDAKIVHLTQGK